MRVRISCVNKVPRDDPYHAIQNVGGINHDNTRWRLSLDDAVAGARNGTYDFYVVQGGHEVAVVTAISQAGNYYLKTVADGYMPDNLLSLVECPRT